MKAKELMEKLWRLQCLMAEIEAKSDDVAERLGFKGMHHKVYDYIRGTEYDDAMQCFCTLPRELQRQFLLDAHNIYEGELK